MSSPWTNPTWNIPRPAWSSAMSLIPAASSWRCPLAAVLNSSHFLKQEKWFQPRMAKLVEIATVIGMIDSAAEFFPWARVQVLVLRDLLRGYILQEYRGLSSPAHSTPSYRTSNANSHVPFPTVFNHSDVENSPSLSGAAGGVSQFSVPLPTP
ncbi:hypothetical protein IV203_033823 [Nitzschia inconspicua]|uniref:Uncharacterized protein n=1 Tax=Nitzschia inconspicua TaxID=303405 RepID=A0A9K3M2X3_9STRA|nr:hypothetical protein IV203_033823 [Nitzschia inconspicua]